MPRELSNETLLKYAHTLLETPVCYPELKTGVAHTRVHDDHDGEYQGSIGLFMSGDGDMWISALLKYPLQMLRYRTWAGGGQSLRVRNALALLAEAIRLDNEQFPQPEVPPTQPT